jgi:hypothetical protein
MRCVLVNGANLKADACCAHCRTKIGESYIREIGTRLMYCDYDCYREAVEAPIPALGYRARPVRLWTFGS